MKILSLIAAALLVSWISFAHAQARTATNAERAACESRIQEKIDAIDSKLRAGSSAREGERLKQRRRELEDRRYDCRKAPKA